MDKWWVPGLNIGYEHSFINQFADFVEGYGSRKKRPNRPDFRDALETQYICEAVLDSAKSGRWKKVGKIKAIYRCLYCWQTSKNNDRPTLTQKKISWKKKRRVSLFND